MPCCLFYEKRVVVLLIIAILLSLSFLFILIFNPVKMIGYTIFTESGFNDTCLNNAVDNSSLLNTQAVLYLKFNNNSYYGETDRVVCDLSGNRNDGLVSGAIWNSSGGHSKMEHLNLVGQ